MSMKITAHTTRAPPMSQNTLIVRSQTMLTSNHKLCSRQITDYAPVRTQTMLTGIRSRSSEKEKPTLCRGPVVSAPTVKMTELMFSVNSTSTAGCCGDIFFILPKFRCTLSNIIQNRVRFTLYSVMLKKKRQQNLIQIMQNYDSKQTPMQIMQKYESKQTLAHIIKYDLKHTYVYTLKDI